jgi:hypothetical protein
MGGKGWPAASGDITAPTTSSPEGGATLKCVAPSTHKCDDTGTFSSAGGNSPPCTRLDWTSKNTWCKKPYCDNMPKKPTPAPAPAPTPSIPGVPHVTVFSEGNGNEHRGSFKAAPIGYAQLIQSPATWIASPMIINTNKRLTDDKSPGPIGGPQPVNSLAPPGADYQGILECPCTTRKPKVLNAYITKPAGGASYCNSSVLLQQSFSARRPSQPPPIALVPRIPPTPPIHQFTPSAHHPLIPSTLLPPIHPPTPTRSMHRW